MMHCTGKLTRSLKQQICKVDCTIIFVYQIAIELETALALVSFLLKETEHHFIIPNSPCMVSHQEYTLDIMHVLHFFLICVISYSTYTGLDLPPVADLVRASSPHTASIAARICQLCSSLCNHSWPSGSWGV